MDSVFIINAKGVFFPSLHSWNGTKVTLRKNLCSYLKTYVNKNYPFWSVKNKKLRYCNVRVECRVLDPGRYLLCGSQGFEAVTAHQTLGTSARARVSPLHALLPHTSLSLLTDSVRVQRTVNHVPVRGLRGECPWQ